MSGEVSGPYGPETDCAACCLCRIHRYVDAEGRTLDPADATFGQFGLLALVVGRSVPPQHSTGQGLTWAGCRDSLLASWLRFWCAVLLASR